MTPNPKAQDSEQNRAEQPNISEHDKAVFEAMVNDSLRCGGLNLCAGKSHGKTRLMFSISDYCRALENSRVIIFDGSEAWLRAYSQIAVYNICETDIRAKQQRHTLDIEAYSWNNWQLVLNVLQSHDDILFRLKTKKASKRGFAIRSIINYLDNEQRKQSETNKELKKLCFFIDETQAAFSNRTTARSDSEEFLTAFAEGRNFSESYHTCSQRLNDLSKTLRTKQNYCIGKINPEDINPQIRRIEKLYSVNLTTLEHRHWLYEGKIFVSPEFKQNKKPFIINAENRANYSQQPTTKYKLIPASNPKPKRSFFEKLFNLNIAKKINEDSKGDFLMLNDDDLMFSEEE